MNTSSKEPTSSDNDDESVNQARSETSDEKDENDIEVPQVYNSFDPENMFTKLQICRYQCGACAKIITEKQLNKHHHKMHSTTPFTMEMYELYEVKDRIRCELCFRRMNETQMLTHRLQNHSDTIMSTGGNQVDSIGNTFQRQHNGLQQDCDPHQNGFVYNASGQSLMYNNSSSFRPLPSYPGTVQRPEQRFLNVCISEIEFQRLANQGRLYIQNGIFFLTDSNSEIN